MVTAALDDHAGTHYLNSRQQYKPSGTDHVLQATIELCVVPGNIIVLNNVDFLVQHVTDSCKDIDEIISFFTMLSATVGQHTSFDRVFTVKELVEATQLCRSSVPDHVLSQQCVKNQYIQDSDAYQWRQTSTEVEILVPVAQHVRSKDVNCLLKQNCLSLRIENSSIFDNTRLCSQVRHECNCDWQFETLGTQRCLLLTFEKATRGPWPTLRSCST